MFPVKCALCKQELDKPGALLFSPPNDTLSSNDVDLVIKQHICVECYDLITSFTFDRLKELQNVNK
jgi:hypothetical protein